MEQKDSFLQQVDRLVSLRGYAPRTNKFYLKASSMYFDWCTGQDVKPEDAPYETAQEFLLHLLKDTGYAPKTVNSYNSVVKFLFHYLFHRPIDRYMLPTLRVDRKAPVILSPREIRIFLDHMPDLKSKAMVALLYGCGLRSCEVVRLRYKDISRERKTVFVEQSKNRDSRYVPVPDYVLDILTRYWFHYGRPKQWLFPGAKTGSHISRATLFSRIRQTAASLHWEEKQIRSHTFRHCLGTHMYEAGCDLYYIQKVLGHKSIASTLVYITIPSSSEKAFDPFRENTHV